MKGLMLANGRSQRLLLVVILAALTLGVYSRSVGNGFVFDDEMTLLNNPRVHNGLTWEGIRWALTTTYASNWHPVTWISHMIDVSLFGFNPWGHHLVNILLHAVNTVLLFLLLVGLTDRIWRGGIVAAFFALHPLHVESVAWITQRKDLLSTFFFLMTLWAYASWARRRTRGGYLLALACFAVGLAAKPMLVTGPIVLILLDLWPLGRWQPPSRSSFVRLVVEKVPFFILAGGAGIMTLIAQGSGGSLIPLRNLPMGLRLANAAAASWVYIWKTIAPIGLAAFYPHPMNTIPPVAVTAAAVGLAAVTGVAAILYRLFPAVTFGWFWYLFTILPVIGIIQVGSQGWADRYTYIPLVGIFIVLVWGFANIRGVTRFGRFPVALFGGSVLIFLAVLTWRQITVWQSDKTLFLHAVEVTDGNWLAHHNLANVLHKEGKRAEARDHYLAAIAAKPDHAEAHNNLGLLLAEEGRPYEAVSHYMTALEINPRLAATHNNLGLAYAGLGRTTMAMDAYRAALRIRPDYVEANNNLALLLGAAGDGTAALEYFHRALAADPDNPVTHFNIGLQFAELGDRAQAVEHLSMAVKLKPDYPEAHNNLAIELAKLGRIDEAIKHFDIAARLLPGDKEIAENRRRAESMRGQ